MEIASPMVHVAGANPAMLLTTSELAEFSEYCFFNEDLFELGRDIFLVADITEDALRTIRRLRISAENCVLLRNEPRVVCPANYDQSKLRYFSKIIDVGRDDACATLSVPCPQNWPPNLKDFFDPSTQRRDSPVLMNANKLSLVEGELYSLRRRLVHATTIELYGPKWDSSLLARLRTVIGEAIIFAKSREVISKVALAEWWRSHPSYKGLAADKLLTYRQYRVAIAIENSPDYTSEKLIDAMLAGCIPVYVGASLSSTGIPSELVICAEPNLESVLLAIDRARGVDYLKWMDNALAYLEKAETKDFWSPLRIYRSISSHILAK